MNSVTHKNIFTLAIALVVAQIFTPEFLLADSNSHTQSIIKDFELTNCEGVNGKCIKITAGSAESGYYSQSLMLKNVTAVITEPSNSETGESANGKSTSEDNKTKSLSYSQKTGIYDITFNRLILSQLNKDKSLEETVISLSDMSVQKLVMK